MTDRPTNLPTDRLSQSPTRNIAVIITIYLRTIAFICFISHWMCPMNGYSQSHCVTFMYMNPTKRHFSVVQ